MNKISLCFSTIFSFLLFNILSPSFAQESNHQETIKEYREHLLKLKMAGTFKIVVPGINQDSIINYEFRVDKFLSGQPKLVDIYLAQNNPGLFIRKFYDKILLTDESFISINGEDLPLTCIYIEGQDNRYLNIDSPLFPKIIFDVILVANDYSCTGPVNPAWPEQGGKEENWDTYLRYKVKDPTIMLPTDAILRLRWNEHKAILVK